MAGKYSPINVGILGLGRSGWGIHVDAITHLPEMFKLVAVTDQLPGRASESAASTRAQLHQSFEQLLADREVELVVVATYNSFHARHAAAALRAEKHVLCEKPFGLTTADVDMMISTSRAAGKVLQPFHQRRFEADFQKVYEVVKSGILGQILFIRICWHGFKRRWDWQTDKSMGGGTMNNNGSHPIDHALELYGEGEPSIWSQMRRCLCSGDAEDHMKIILTGDKKPTVEVELTDVFAYPQDRWFVCGTAGGLRGTANALEWKWVDWSQMPPRPLELQSTPDRGYNSESLKWQSASWQPAGSADAAPGRHRATAGHRSVHESFPNDSSRRAPENYPRERSTSRCGDGKGSTMRRILLTHRYLQRDLYS